MFMTKRLFARHLMEEDLEGFHSLRSDPRVTRQYGVEPYTRERSAEKVAELIQDRLMKRSYTYAIFLRESNEFVGSITLWNLEPEKHSGEIGYEIIPEYWKRGLASEILSPFMKSMKKKYGFETFNARPFADNISSNQLLISEGFIFKNTFENDGVIHNYYEKTI